MNIQRFPIPRIPSQTSMIGGTPPASPAESTRSLGASTATPQLLRTLGLALCLFVLLGIFGSAPVDAQVGTCLEGWYKLCDGECPAEHTDQGECTTRLESVGGTTVKWCCCPNDFDPYGSGGETTPGGPPGPIGDCPGDEGDCPECPDGDCKNCSSPWAASAAVAGTANPSFTDQVLYLIRDNILKRHPRGMGHIEAVYRHAKEIDRILVFNPELLQETTRLLRQNLWKLLELGNNLEIEVTSEELERVAALMTGFANATSDPDLQLEISRALRDLGSPSVLRAFGVHVVD